MRNQRNLLQSTRPRTARTFFVVVALGAFSYWLVPCLAQPSEVSYQGELKKDGLPFTGMAQMKFVIIDVEGESIWSNDGTSAAGSEPMDFASIETENGIFAVRLGAVPMEPISGGLLKGVTEVALRVWVNTGDGFEQLTDQPISSSAFSLSGEKCLEIGDLQINVVPRWDGSALVPGALFDDGNNVGVGTNAPATKLDVSGTVRSSAGGFQFPDGTTQTTAVTGGGGGVPSGAMIFTNSPIPPDGYSFSGMTMTTSNSDSWRAAAAAPIVRANFGAAEANGAVYLIGGFSPTTSGFISANYEYNPVTNSWTERAPMPLPRGWVGCVSLDGQVYVIGGQDSTLLLDRNERYDSATNTWTTLTPMSIGRSGLGLATVSGKIFALGGSVPFEGISASAEGYDLLTDSWFPLSPLPAARYSFSTAVLNGRVFVFGGIDSNGQYQASVFEYDPELDNWTTRPDMPSARIGTAACSVENRIFVAGGAIYSPQYGTIPVTSMEEFDPSLDTWVGRPDMPFGSQFLGMAFANDSLFVFSSLYSSSVSATVRYSPPVYFYAHTKN